MGYPIPAPPPPPAQALVTVNVAQMLFYDAAYNISTQNTFEVRLHCDAFNDDFSALIECILIPNRREM